MKKRGFWKGLLCATIIAAITIGHLIALALGTAEIYEQAVNEISKNEHKKVIKAGNGVMDAARASLTPQNLENLARHNLNSGHIEKLGDKSTINFMLPQNGKTANALKTVIMPPAARAAADFKALAPSNFSIEFFENSIYGFIYGYKTSM